MNLLLGAHRITERVMAISGDHRYSVYYLAYRPDFTGEKTILLEVLLVSDSLEQPVLRKKLEDWKPILAADPGADIQLISEIVDEVESRASWDRDFLDRSTEWSTSLEVSKSEVWSAELPSRLITELFDAFPKRERCDKDQC
jgi:hypothetical protein